MEAGRHTKNFFRSFVLLSLIAPSTFASAPRIDRDAIRDHFRGKTRVIRSHVFDFESYHLRGDAVSPNYTYHGYYLPAPTKVEIRDVDLNDGSLHLGFVAKNSNHNTGELNVSWIVQESSPTNTQELIDLLETAFVPEIGPDVFHPLVINSKSHVAHYAGANHLPAVADQIPANAVGESKKCPVCFPTRRWLGPGESDEYSMARAANAEVARFRKLLRDKDAVERLRASAARVFAKWPEPLTGYEYEYAVLDEPELNAFAIPTGSIYVTKGLLASIESDDELDAVMAHEIAHVEGHHALQEYLAEQSRVRTAQVTSAVLAVGAGVAAGINSNNPSVGIGAATAAIALSSPLMTVINRITAAGYSQGLELDADFSALRYLESLGGRPKRSALKSILLKTDSAISAHAASNHWTSTHPSIADRLDAIDGTDMGADPAPGSTATYIYKTSAGEKVAELALSRSLLRSYGKRRDLTILGTLTVDAPYFKVNVQDTIRAIRILDLNPTSGASGNACDTITGVSVPLQSAGKTHLVFKCNSVADPVPAWRDTAWLRQGNGNNLRMTKL